MSICLGYEIKSGRPVHVPLNHTAVLGQTQESGKTTTQEAMIVRSGLRAVAFITKRGEKSFRLSKPIPAFFRESTTGPFWKYVATIVEGALELKLGFQERGYLMMMCEENKHTRTVGTGKKQRVETVYEWRTAKSLPELQENLKVAKNHLRGTAKMICMQLAEYLAQVIPEIARAKFSDTLKLNPGINVMDIAKLSVPLQALVIRSTIEWVLRHERNTVVVVPEAWKFIGKKNTPVKAAAEQFIREGATLKNYLWLDSQDLRGVDPLLLRSIGVWIFGVQRERNEVANTLDSIPDLPKPQAADIMRLRKGQFYAAFGDTCVLTYVRPAGMGEEHAKAIARGEESADSWKKIVAELDNEPAESDTAHADYPAGMPTDNESDPAAHTETGSDGAGKDATAEKDTDNLGSGTVGAAPIRLVGDAPNEKESTTGNQAANGDDMLWKERAEEAETEVIRLKQRIAVLESVVGAPQPSSLSFPPENGTVTAAAAAPGTPAAAPVPLGGKGREFVDIYPELRRMILADQAVLAKVSVLQPQLDVTVERIAIEMKGNTLVGNLARMLHRGFFKSPKQSADARRELIRVGAADDRLSNANLSNALKKLNEYGFLTAEAEGWLEVPGMKVNILEK